MISIRSDTHNNTKGILTVNLVAEWFFDVEECSTNVVKELLSGPFLLYESPQHPGLLKVLISDSCRVDLHFSVPVFVCRHTMSAAQTDGSELGPDVIRIASIIAVESCTTIPFVGIVDLDMSTIGRKLLVVGTQAVAGSIWVSKHTCLEDCSRLSATHPAGKIQSFNSPMSADGPMPGTMFDGEKAACSMS